MLCTCSGECSLAVGPWQVQWMDEWGGLWNDRNWQWCKSILQFSSFNISGHCTVVWVDQQAEYWELKNCVFKSFQGTRKDSTSPAVGESRILVLDMFLRQFTCPNFFIFYYLLINKVLKFNLLSYRKKQEEESSDLYQLWWGALSTMHNSYLHYSKRYHFNGITLPFQSHCSKFLLTSSRCN